jgi:hypothetical protein
MVSIESRAVDISSIASQASILSAFKQRDIILKANYKNTIKKPIDMNKTITEEKLKKYFEITKEALDMIDEKGIDETRKSEALDFLDMASRYFSDAEHFYKQDDYVLAYGALNYAHGWLDAGARIKLFKVSDSRLFTVDDG